MSKSMKLLVGILSLLPIVFMVIYFIVFFSIFLDMMRHIHNEEMMPEIMFKNIAWIIGFAIIMGLTSLGLKVYFIVHAISNTTIDSPERIVWILVFIFAGLIGFPLYWYMRIWKDPLPVQ